MGGLGYNRYIYLFQDLPAQVVLLRYAGSWFWRILGLVVGVGLLFRKDICRKIGIGLCWYTIVTIYLKHPYAALDHAIQELVRQGAIDPGVWAAAGMSYPAFVGTSVIMACSLDVLFFTVFIFYFQRADVRKFFK